LNRDVVAISARLLRKFREHNWPGNIRELESTIERALISSTENDLLDLDEPLQKSFTDADGGISLEIPEGADLADIERTYIIAVLEKTGGQVGGSGGAAALLGMPSSTLRSKMKKLGIDRD
jgi:formate hydrogenlyase transcriptional activator